MVKTILCLFLIGLFSPLHKSKIRALIRCIYFCNKVNYKYLSKICSLLLENHGIHISHNASIHPSTYFPHPVGIVIGNGVVIKKNVVIFQNVTIGGLNFGGLAHSKYPKLSEGTIVYAGAIIVGPICIGHSAIIGANALVRNDVPSMTVYGGVPAKFLSARRA